MSGILRYERKTTEPYVSGLRVTGPVDPLDLIGRVENPQDVPGTPEANTMSGLNLGIDEYVRLMRGQPPGATTMPLDLARIANLLGVPPVDAPEPQDARITVTLDLTTPHGIKALRTALNLDRAAFAARLRCSPAAVARWEQGQHRPQSVYVARMKEMGEEQAR